MLELLTYQASSLKHPRAYFFGVMSAVITTLQSGSIVATS
jgi:hypothetical protein